MIIVYISDARDEYSRSMFEKVGLPARAQVKVRYSAKRIQPPLREGLTLNKLTGRDLLLCYMSGNRGDLRDARAIATRYAQIAKSERIADFISIDCSLRGFPSSANLADLFATTDDRGLVSPGPQAGLFVVDGVVPQDERLTDASPERWISIVRELTTFPYFQDASFVYMADMLNTRKNSLTCEGGVFHVGANARMVARIHTLAATKESRLHRYEMRADENVIELVNYSDISLAFGRESFDVQFATLPTERSRPAYIRVEPGPGENGAYLSIPVEVQARWLALAGQRAVLALSGAAAATAGVLPDSSPMTLRIALVVIGSIGIALMARRPS